MTIERLKELIAVLQDTKAIDDELRRSARANVQSVVQITRIAADASRRDIERAVLKDVSLRGLRIIFSKELAGGERFVLHLRGKERGVADLLCRVVHCHRAEKGVFSIGAEFDFAVANNANKEARVASSELDRIRASMFS